MAISSNEIRAILAEWSERPAGSEAEMEAREALMARLSGEYGVVVSEAALTCTKGPNVFPVSVAIGFTALTIMALASTAAASLGMLALIAALYRVHTARAAPFVMPASTRQSANMAAKTPDADNVTLLVAALDTAHRQTLFDHLKIPDLFRFMGAAEALVNARVRLMCLAMAALLAVLLMMLRDAFLPGYMLVSVLSLLALLPETPQQRQYSGERDGADRDLAATISAATRYWRDLDDNEQVILLLTSGHHVGRAGLFKFLRDHAAFLRARKVRIIACTEDLILPFRKAGYKAWALNKMPDPSVTEARTATDLSNALETLLIENRWT